MTKSMAIPFVASRMSYMHRVGLKSLILTLPTMVYTTPTKVAKIVSWKAEGHNDSEISRRARVHRKTVSSVLKRYEKSHDPYFVNKKTGRPRKMDIRETRLAARMLAKTEAANATEVQKKALKHVSPRTVNRHLREAGLVCQVRKAKPYLSVTYKSKRLAWAKTHCNWTIEDWQCVVFSDESKFMLFKSDGCQYAWFKPGQALDGRYTKKTVKHGGGSLMVWGCISARGMGRLHRIEGTMKAVDYVAILEEQYLGSLTDLGLQRTGNSSAIFQQDNDPKHRSKLTSAWFLKKRIKTLPWAPSSPDMNIIEHVWDQVDTLVRTRDPLPRNKEELWVALEDEWANFPQSALDKLYESMPRRVEELLNAKGGHTKY